MNSNSLVKTGMFLMIVSLIIAFLIVAQNILIPLAISAFFAYLLYPFVWLIEKKGIHRGIAIFLVLSVVMIVIGAATLPLVIKLSNMTIDFTEIQKQLGAKTDSFQHILQDKIGINGQTMDYYIEEFTKDIVSFWQSSLGSIFDATTTTVFQIGILPVFIFFFLFYRTKTAYFIFRVAGREEKPMVLKILREISTVITKYLGGVSIVVATLAILNSLGLFIIGVKHALVFGVLAAILNLVPYIGTFLGGFIPFLYVFFTVSNPTGPMVKIVILFTFIQILENNLLTPNIVGNSVNINPLAIIISLLFANMVWGIAGMFIIIPFLAILKVIMRNIDGLKPFAYLISRKGVEKHKFNLRKPTHKKK